jgi:hypothetical protein
MMLFFPLQRLVAPIVQYRGKGEWKGQQVEEDEGGEG